MHAILRHRPWLIRGRQFVVNERESHRVVLITNTLNPGGTERNIIALASNLSGRFSPEIWSLFDVDEALAKRFSVRVFGRFVKFDPVLVVRLAFLMHRHPARVFHIFHFAFGIHVLLANVLLLGRKKLVFSFGGGRYELSRFVFWPYAKMLNRTASVITGNSASTSKELSKDGVDPRRIRIVVNGHDVAPFESSPTKDESRAATELPKDDFIVVTTGRLVASKRVCDLVDAVALSAVQGQDWLLVILGDGPEREALESQVGRLQVHDRVRLVGNVAKEDVVQYLNSADLFAFASESEGLPNSLIEASMAALPIVACKVDGVVDVIEHGENGILVPKRDPQSLSSEIGRLQQDTAERKKLGEKARALALKNYSLEKMVNTFEDIYSQLISSGH